jgi:hypothetical protein
LSGERRKEMAEDRRGGSVFKKVGKHGGGGGHNGIMDAKCNICRGGRWVCEDHPDKPWDGASDAPEACHCGGAGAPCPACNPSDSEHPPEMPEGYKSIQDAGTDELTVNSDRKHGNKGGANNEKPVRRSVPAPRE